MKLQIQLPWLGERSKLSIRDFISSFNFPHAPDAHLILFRLRLIRSGKNASVLSSNKASAAVTHAREEHKSRLNAAGLFCSSAKSD